MREAIGVAAVAIALITVVPGAAAKDAAPVDLQAIIDAAPAWSVLNLPAGVYRGGVVIAKPLTIEGAGVVIDAAGTGSVVEVTSPDVTLRGLVLRNSGISPDGEDAAVSAHGADRLIIDGCIFEDVLFGVFLSLSPDAVIRNTLIGAKDLEPGRRGDGLRLWESPRAVIEGNVVRDGRDTVAFYSDDIVVRGNSFTTGRYGLHFMYASGALVEGNVFEGNSVGAYVMYSEGVTFRDNAVLGSAGPSGYGLGLKDSDDTEATGNRFVGNRVGIYLDNSPIGADAWQSFSGNLVAFNDIGVLFTASVERNRFSGNAFVSNGDPVAVSGSGVLEGNLWTVEGVGNHWDDYRGFDADRDGIGDISYRLDDLYSAMRDRHPELALFAGTPAARAVDLTGRMFPSLEPVPKVIDMAPLMAPPDMAPAPLGAVRSEAGPLLVASLALLAVAAVIIMIGARRSAP